MSKMDEEETVDTGDAVDSNAMETGETSVAWIAQFIYWHTLIYKLIYQPGKWDSCPSCERAYWRFRQENGMNNSTG